MKRRTVHLVANAHLDPVWLWRWEDGLAETIATFRVAVELCEREAGFVFCADAAAQHEWVRQQAPQLFARIRRQARRGRWRVVGGTWVQPDLNLVGGEAMIRHSLLGQAWFRRHLGCEAAVSFAPDAFGQSEGLAQVLAGCGYAGHLFCRPGPPHPLPAGGFLWRDRSGVGIPARRADDHYQTIPGGDNDIDRKLARWPAHYADEGDTLLLWGVGNHGGGVSRALLRGLRRGLAAQPALVARHSSPEAWFTAQPTAAWPVVTGELQGVCPGCYTSLARVKRAWRSCEAQLLGVERLAALAWWRGLASHPAAGLEAAWRDLLFTSFHDILPGSCVPGGEADALACLGGVEERLRQLRGDLLGSLARRWKPSRPGRVPVLIWNPHPFPVEHAVEATWVATASGNPRGSLRLAGPLAGQRETEDGTVPFDWVLRAALPLRLRANEVRRIDLATVRSRPRLDPPARPRGRTLTVRTAAFRAVLDLRSGCLASFAAPGGPELVGPEAFQPVVFRDRDSSWRCGDPRRGDERDPWPVSAAPFRLASAAQARSFGLHGGGGEPPIRVVEDGPVRTVVEALLVQGRCAVQRRWIFGRRPAVCELRDRILWLGAERMLKLRVPLAFAPGQVAAEACHSAAQRAPDQAEHPNLRWVAALGADRVLGIANDGSHGHHLRDGCLHLNLLRSPAYACMGFTKRPDQAGRFQPRQDQGEHQVAFRLLPQASWDEGALRRAAEVLNLPPAALAWYPGGEGDDDRDPFRACVEVAPASVQVVALKRSEDGRALLIRLLQTTGRSVGARLRLDGRLYRIPLGPFRLATLRLERGGRLRPCDLRERPG